MVTTTLIILHLWVRVIILKALKWWWPLIIKWSLCKRNRRQQQSRSMDTKETEWANQLAFTHCRGRMKCSSTNSEWFVDVIVLPSPTKEQRDAQLMPTKWEECALEKKRQAVLDEFPKWTRFANALGNHRHRYSPENVLKKIRLL